MATWNEFLAKLGTTINVGGTQCVAVANYYHQYVLGLGQWPGVSSAYQWYVNFNSYSTLMNNYVRYPAGSVTPQVGDIVVEKQNAGNGQHGHIAVIVSGWDGKGYWSYDQNVSGRQWVHKIRKTGSEALGFLRPLKNAPGAVGGPVAFEPEEVLTEEQKRLLEEIYLATRVGSTGINAKLKTLKDATDSIYKTVSESIVRDSNTYTQKQDMEMLQNLLKDIEAIVLDMEQGFESVGYDNIILPGEINYYQSEAGPGETSIEKSMRDKLNDTKFIK